MKQSLYTFLIFMFIFSHADQSTASHAVGADLTYVCLGGNNYRFFLTLYRDCSGITVNTSYTIAGSASCGDTLSFPVSQDSVREIAHTCSTVVTTCVNFSSPYMGVEANYYHGDITLPSVCNFWKFGPRPALCNRNAAINNLDPNGSVYCLYVEATLNNAAVACNSSPSFQSQPVQFLCANQLQYYVEHAYDINGDSLVYQMITPHSDALSDVQYVPGLSSTQPVFYIDSTTYNSQSGDIRFFANGPQITVIAIQVSEYHNGILIGSVERDIELIFENCLNNLPAASGINGSNLYSMHVCAGTPVAFFINTSDADAAQQTSLMWNGGIPGALFINSGTHRDTGFFQWQPGAQHISSQPHIFTVTVMDNACPQVGISSYSYAIYVDSCSSTGISPSARNCVQFFSAGYSPVNHTIHFSYRLTEASAVVVSLYDIAGRELNNAFIAKSKEADRILNVQGISPGVYLLNLKSGNGISQSIKVMVE
jgi:hypothetical protein